MKTKYLIQQGVDGACIYWNSKKEYSCNTDDLAEGGWDNREDAQHLRDVWDIYGEHRSTFKVVEVQVEAKFNIEAPPMPKAADLKKCLVVVTNLDGHNNRISVTQKAKREFVSPIEDSYYFTVSVLTKINHNWIFDVVADMDHYMKKFGYAAVYKGECHRHKLADNVVKQTYDYQKPYTRTSMQVVYSRKAEV